MALDTLQKVSCRKLSNCENLNGACKRIMSDARDTVICSFTRITQISDKMPFHGHHSYFRKDFKMLIAHKKSEI